MWITLVGRGAATAALGLLCAAPSAGAATEIGQVTPPDRTVFTCAAEQSTVQTGVSPDASYTVPAGGGVITAWRHNADTFDAGSGRLQVWRPPPAGTTYTLHGRSELQSFTAGTPHRFPTRIPVGGGELIGLRVASNAGCSWDAFGAGASDLYRNSGAPTPDPGPGEVVNMFDLIPDSRLNVSATVEPDADGDGFGDESQDLCLGEAGPENGCVFPETTLTGRPKDKTKKKTATFAFGSSKPGSTFQCAVDGQALRVPCTSPYKVKVKRGRHTFQVRAVDPVGNTDPTPESDSWKVKKKKR